MGTPTVCCLSAIDTYDPGLQLRLEHSHGSNSHGEGGHYHYDTTPGEVKYRAYYNVAEMLYRVDKPEPERCIFRPYGPTSCLLSHFYKNNLAFTSFRKFYKHQLFPHNIFTFTKQV